MSFFKNLKTTLLPLPAGERAGVRGRSSDTLGSGVGHMDFALVDDCACEPVSRRNTEIGRAHV